MKKVYASAAEAAGLVKDDTLMMGGGFGLCGVPETLIDAVRQTGVKGRRLEPEIRDLRF